MLLSADCYAYILADALQTDVSARVDLYRAAGTAKLTMQMQQLIRSQGAEAMNPDQYKKFTELHESGQLQKPEV